MSLAEVPQLATAGTTRTPPARRRPATQPSLPALVLARPSRFARAVGTGLLLLLLMTPLLLVFVPWTQSVEGSGQVVGLSPLDREFTVESPIYGRVKKWYVSEGSFVRGPRVEGGTPVPGDLLAELSNNDPQYLNALVAGQRAIEDKIANANLQAQTYADILEDLGTARDRAIEAATNDVQVGEQKIEQVRNELEITKIDRETEAWNLKQYQEASKSGLMTEQQLYQARQKYVSADNKFLKAQLEVKQAEVDLKSKKAKLREVTAKTQAELSKIETDIQAARTKVAEYQKELAEAESKVRNQSSQNVRAPRDGYIRRLLVNEGVQQLKDDEPIAILTPSSPHLAVELYLDGNDTPLVHPGDPVRLQFEGWPAVQIPGWPGVAVGTFPGKVRLIDAGVSAKGKFRLIIEPVNVNQWPSGRYLRQGVQAKGWVLLRQVPLGYELWRRLNSFPPLIASVEPGQGKGGNGSAPLPPGLEDEKEKVKVKRPK